MLESCSTINLSFFVKNVTILRKKKSRINTLRPKFVGKLHQNVRKCRKVAQKVAKKVAQKNFL